jgi:hypothetical protein
MRVKAYDVVEKVASEMAKEVALQKLYKKLSRCYTLS